MTQKTFTKGSVYPPLKPGVLRLYSMRFCPFAQRTRLVLANKNIPFETINVDLKNKPDWLLEKNPQGLVPVLELGDKIVYESTATSEWLDDVYINTRLQPTDPYTKAWDRILLEYYGKLITVFFGALSKPEDKEQHVENIQKIFQFYEDVLAKRGGPFFGGKSPAMVDMYLWPIFERLPVAAAQEPRLNVDKTKYPKLGQWVDAMLTRPEVKAIMHDTKTHAHFLDTHMKGSPDYDYGLA